MIVCPVCEHQQVNGGECELCGKNLTGAVGGVEVSVVPIEGLEPTSPGAAGEVPVQPLIELEVTRQESPALNVAAMVELDQTGFGPTLELAIEPVELSDDRAPDDGQRTALPSGPVTCRYCRNVQASGLICDTCGMRLPYAAGDAAPVVGGVIAGEGERVRCKSCGAPAKAGGRCGDCGREVPFPEA
jgi:hypothetical protein